MTALPDIMLAVQPVTVTWFHKLQVILSAAAIAAVVAATLAAFTGPPRGGGGT